MKLAYRSDIDGLRAIAVLAVIIFHFNKNWLPGGFLGVDIFFVISGFLITSIIAKEIQSNTFSLKEFYLRRIKRIVPASLFYTGLTFLACYLIFLPHDLGRAAKSALSTIVFASNFYFARNVDYFAVSSDENPFLHTWSLSVEEQFYVFWPLILIGLARLAWTLKTNTTVLTVLTLISITLGTIWASSEATQKLAFYMLPSRFGELLIGAIGAIVLPSIIINKRLTNLLYVVGSVLLVSSLLFITEKHIFPGLLAMPICIGTLLFIIAGYSNHAKANLFYKLLSSPLASYFGKISFSLYLAHWPILAMHRYISQSYELSTSAIFVCASIILISAHLSWKWIEMPCRKLKLNFTKSFIFILAIPSSVMLVISIITILNKGLPERFKLQPDSFKVAKKSLCHTHLTGDCLLGDKSNILPYLLIGDSHAGHYLTYFDELGKINHFSIEGRSVDGCPASFSNQNVSRRMTRLSDCTQLRQYITNNANNFSHIIIAERWDSSIYSSSNYIQELENFLNKMQLSKIKVMLMAQVPKYQCNVSRSSALNNIIPWAKQCGNDLDTNYLKANNIIKQLASKHVNTQFISINMLLCTPLCSPYIKDKMIYKDDDHLNIVGSIYLANASTALYREWFK